MFTNMIDRFVSSNSRPSKERVTFPIVKSLSLYDEIPWDEYLAEDRQFSFVDGTSVMAGYLLQQSASGNFHTVARLASMIGMIVPVEKKNPWVLQWYISVGDANDLSGANVPIIRLMVYRRYCQSKAKTDPVEELNELCNELDDAFVKLKLDATRMDGKSFYQWMATWLNPSISNTHLMNTWPYQAGSPDADEVLYELDLADVILQSEHVVDDNSGVWYFNKSPTVYVPVESITYISSEKIAVLWENMPVNTTCVLTILFSNNRAKKILDKESSKDIGDIPELHGITLEKLYQFHLGFYTSDINRASLEKAVNRLIPLLLCYGIKSYNPFVQDDKYRIGNVIRHLPGVFKYTAARFSAREARYLHGSDLMSLLPLVKNQSPIVLEKTQ
ncbi:TraC family protein [bacterium]|nr:TraC family protein [bacterium]